MKKSRFGEIDKKVLNNQVYPGLIVNYKFYIKEI
jgi:hypothetical protein